MPKGEGQKTIGKMSENPRKLVLVVYPRFFSHLTTVDLLFYYGPEKGTSVKEIL